MRSAAAKRPEPPSSATTRSLPGPGQPPALRQKFQATEQPTPGGASGQTALPARPLHQNQNHTPFAGKVLGGDGGMGQHHQADGPGNGLQVAGSDLSISRCCQWRLLGLGGGGGSGWIWMAGLHRGMRACRVARAALTRPPAWAPRQEWGVHVIPPYSSSSEITSRSWTRFGRP